jgi:hypothetical protein
MPVFANGEQPAHSEAVGITAYVPVMCTVSNLGDGTLFGRTDFRFERESDTYICSGNKRLRGKHTNRKDRYTMYKFTNLNIPKIDLVKVFLDLLEAETLQSKDLANEHPACMSAEGAAMVDPPEFKALRIHVRD